MKFLLSLKIKTIEHRRQSEHKTENHAGHVHHSDPVEKTDVKQEFQKYTCPMHPQIIQDSPGNCPLCGMTLVPLTKPGTHGGHETHSAGIADFKKRFYVVLILTIPIMLLSKMIQHWLNIHFSFPGSGYVLPMITPVCC